MSKKFMEKKAIIFSTIIAIVCISAAIPMYAAYNSIQDKNTSDSQNKTELTGKTITTNDLQEKTEKFNNLDEAKDKLPYKVEKPAYTPKGLIEDKTECRIVSNFLGKLYITNIKYKDSNDNKKKIFIAQVNETGKPDLSSYEKININGVDAWITPNTSNMKGIVIQIMFWRDSKYFNVSGENIAREELIKVAESLS